MFFLNINLDFIKTNFFTKTNLAIIQTSLPTISYFERDKNNTFSIGYFISKNEIFLKVLQNVKQNVTHLNLSFPETLFHKVKFVSIGSLATNSFYDIKTLNLDSSLIESLLESFSFFLLLLTVLIYWFETAFHSKAGKQKFGSLMVKLSNLSLTFLLGTRWITSHHFPLSNLYESLLFLSWSLTIIHFILEKISNTLLIGVLLSPITLFINGFALFTLPIEMQRGNFLTPALQSNWLMMHVTVMISSYAALLSGSILAIAFLIITRDTSKNDSAQNTIITGQKFPDLILQNKSDRVFLQSKSKPLTSDSKDLFLDEVIKKNYNSLAFVEENQQLSTNSEFSLKETPFSKNQNNFSSFSQSEKGQIDSHFFLLKPVSLKNTFFEEKDFLQNDLAKTLDNLSYRTIGIGFPLLTIGILSGAVWANEAWGSYWSWDPKETWALITWFLFAIYLHTRITKGLQGEKPAIIATLGFVVVWICFLGVNLASQGLHTYGWLQ